LFKTALRFDPAEEAELVNPPVLPFDLGDYTVLDEIGRGGQGVVYRARQKSLNRTVALKVIVTGPWTTEGHLKRFRTEAEAAASLNHPFIVPIHEIGERDGCCYFSMNLIEGGQLNELLDRDPMSPSRAATLVAELARTVQFAHEHGILHRDIKPGNILLDRDCHPHLTDFGLARVMQADTDITMTSEMLGTPSYVAPEQVSSRNTPATPATDVYGLGAVLYHLLTGKPPFAGETTYETIRQVLEVDPPEPRILNEQLDRGISTVCLKCLEKNPSRRYDSALSLSQDLERWLRNEAVEARRTGPWTRGKKWVQRHPAISVAAAAVIILGAVVGKMIWSSYSARSPGGAGIAVLPFENLSDDTTNAYFAAGIQDEILTRLSKVSALRVISRTSTQQYSARPENLREIARQLGVANVLEGSVQKVAGQAHINVQLIRAATDEHLWAETYDRKLNDIFSVEAEVAARVAGSLKAKLTSPEAQALSEKPTHNPQAYDEYLRGLAYALRPRAGFYDRNTLGAIQHFSEAVKLDPEFALAWAWLAQVSSLGYFNLVGNDVAASRETAQFAVAKATQLQPNVEETCLAQGYFHYYCEHNYKAAVGAFEKARQAAPRASEVLEALALISRRINEWDRSLEYFRQAIDVDPRNISLLSSNADTFCELRRYSAALKIYNQILEISPDNPDALVGKASIYQSEGNLVEAGKLLAQTPSDSTSEISFPAQIRQKVYQRNFSDAGAMLKKALAKSDQSLLAWQKIYYRATLADVQQFSGDGAGARSTWEQVKAEIERLPGSKLSSLGFKLWLGEAHNALGEKSKALAIVHEFFTQGGDTDRLEAAKIAAAKAQIAIHADDKDVAIAEVAVTAQNPVPPNGLDYGDLKLNPLWDPLRSDPRFQQILTSLLPSD
jgi:serine/threonine protein kinase/Tfp pilus assembly protein PilF